MSASLYDEALIAKLKNWTENTSVHIYGPNEAKRLIEVLADETKDKPIKLPIISISRVGGYNILNANKKRLTYDGMMYQSTQEKSISLNAVPIQINYQIDVMTRYLKEADAYMRNLIFNIINFPNLDVVIPYNSDSIQIHHNSAIRIITDVLDNSNDNRLSIGQFTRLSIGISIDDAYIWDTRIKDNLSISFDVDELNLKE